MIWQQREPNWFHNSPFQNRRNLLYPLIYSFHLAWTSIVESFVRFGKSHRLESLSRRPFHMKLQGYSQVLWVFFPFIFLSFFPFLRVLSSVNVRVEKWLNLKRSVTIREVFKKKSSKEFQRITINSFTHSFKEFWWDWKRIPKNVCRQTPFDTQRMIQESMKNAKRILKTNKRTFMELIFSKRGDFLGVSLGIVISN